MEVSVLAVMSHLNTWKVNFRPFLISKQTSESRKEIQDFKDTFLFFDVGQVIDFLL